MRSLLLYPNELKLSVSFLEWIDFGVAPMLWSNSDVTVSHRPNVPINISSYLTRRFSRLSYVFQKIAGMFIQIENSW